MRFSPSHLVTDLDALSSFSACCASNLAFCAEASSSSLMEMSVCWAEDLSVRSAGNYFLSRSLYPLARMLRGGGDGQVVFTEAAPEGPTERARNKVVSGVYAASFPYVTMAGYMTLKYFCQVTLSWLRNTPPSVWGTGQIFRILTASTPASPAA